MSKNKFEIPEKNFWSSTKVTADATATFNSVTQFTGEYNGRGDYPFR